MRRLIAVLMAGFAMLAALSVPAAASPAAERCVGLVVDFGPGSVQSTCVPFRNGMTGADVLAAAKHKIAKATSGLICQIDRHPGSCTSDAKHFWGYFHRAPGTSTWAFSLKGADTYKVHPGETEGWSFGDNRQPRAVPYARLQAAIAPTATPLRPTASTPATSASTTRSAAANPKSDDDDSSGTSWGLIIGIIAVVLIAGAAGWRQYRTRRQS